MIAVLSDMDGVLVDSGAAVERVWRRWAAKHDLDHDAVAHLIHGRPSREAVAAVLPHADADEESRWIEDEQARDVAGVAAIPGARELLTTYAPLAVVTSATLPLATARFRAAALPVPEHLVTADRIAAGKPDPEGYLLAARLLGVAPSRCVVLEDSPAGLAAARAAGMRAIGVLTTHAPHELGDAQLLVADLEGLAARLRQGGDDPLR